MNSFSIRISVIYENTIRNITISTTYLPVDSPTETSSTIHKTTTRNTTIITFIPLDSTTSIIFSSTIHKTTTRNTTISTIIPLDSTTATTFSSTIHKATTRNTTISTITPVDSTSSIFTFSVYEFDVFYGYILYCRNIENSCFLFCIDCMALTINNQIGFTNINSSIPNP